MCPPGYHHNDIMAARELGHTMYGYTLYDCIVESPECSNCEQWAMHNANSERLSERLSTQSIRVLNRMYLERNIQ